MEQSQRKGPKIHCLTNPVAMQDTANLLLAAGGSAIMAQDPAEVEEITTICQATLLNTGVPDEAKFKACILAGKQANRLGHPVILDPVGAGASRFRQEGLKQLLMQVRLSLIRCNQEEACALLRIKDRIKTLSKDADEMGETSGEESWQKSEAGGGVESQIVLEGTELEQLAVQLAEAYACAVLISGETDAISDGTHICLLDGGSERMRRLTGSGCMLSALCALFCGLGIPPYEAAEKAGKLWKESARRAESHSLGTGGGIGSFRGYLFDAIEELCYDL